ncbi:MAG: phasin family protein, partial [Steroidobacteraceae bacterium]|nr:phasin family protein [Steroidobacteraceae bacterium]
MVNKIKDFVTEQREILAEQAGKLRTDPVKAARAASMKSAERIKALKDPIRAVSRSGIKLTAISQNTAERLIQLQEQLVTSALTDAAAQLERAARADNVVALVRDQADVLRATRERIVSDITEAVTILKDAGGDVRKVATHTYESVTGKAEAAAPKAKVARRKVKRAVRK